MALKVGSTYVDELVYNGTSIKEIIVNGTQVDKKYKVTLRVQHTDSTGRYATRSIVVSIPHYSANGTVTYTTSTITLNSTSKDYSFWVRKGHSMKIDFSGCHIGSWDSISQRDANDSIIKEGKGTKLILDTIGMDTNRTIVINSQSTHHISMDIDFEVARITVNGVTSSYFTKDSGSSSDATWA